MFQLRIHVIVAALLLLPLFASADNKPAKPSQMTDQTRMLVIRSLNAEFVFARRVIPGGKDGLRIKNGQVTPDPSAVEQSIVKNGLASKPGDRAQITNVLIKGDRIRFELNGGPQKKAKWYQHIQVGGMGGTATPGGVADTSVNPKGSVIELVFDKYIPEMTGDQIRELLAPVLDFHAKSAVEAYLDTVPPKVKDAIKDHNVLVGMNKEMVIYAKGRPDRKIREAESGTPYEEWLYGTPPKEVQFVRFVGDEVVRLEIMQVNGEKVVRTAKEVDINEMGEAKLAKKEESPKPTKAPSLKRPGEQPAGDSPLSSQRSPLPPDSTTSAPPSPTSTDPASQPPGQTDPQQQGPVVNVPIPTGNPGNIPPPTQPPPQ
jgi:hypothetical protein